MNHAISARPVTAGRTDEGQSHSSKGFENHFLQIKDSCWQEHSLTYTAVHFIGIREHSNHPSTDTAVQLIGGREHTGPP